MRPWLTAALLGAVAMLVQGCGQGLFDRASALADAAAIYDGEIEAILPPMDDAMIPVDDEPKPPVDDVAKPNEDLPKPQDDGSNQPVSDDGKPADDVVVQTFDANGGPPLTLGSATLTIAPGTFKDPVQIKIRQIGSIEHTGAYGPVFEISVPAPHLFRQTPLLTLQVPDLSPNQSFLPYAALGTLDPSKSLADQQWVPTETDGSSLSSDQKSVSGSVTDFDNLTVVQFGVVIGCPTMTCPSHQACNSSACQQCPTLTNCP